MAPALRRQCQLEGCNYVTVEGLATQDAVLKDLELHLEFHKLNLRKTEPCQLDDRDYITVVGLATQDPVLKNLELHLRFHELTTDQTESAVEKKKNETNCEGDELWRENRPHKETNSGGRANLTSRQTVEEEQTSPQE